MEGLIYFRTFYSPRTGFMDKALQYFSVNGPPASGTFFCDHVGFDRFGNDSVELWPNPSSGTFLIKSISPLSAVAIHSVEGRVVKVTEHLSQRSLYLDATDLSPGMYLLTGVCGTQPFVTKLVIAR
jgi:hypothetical protein